MRKLALKSLPLIVFLVLSLFLFTPVKANDTNLASISSGFWSGAQSQCSIWQTGMNPYIIYPVTWAGKSNVIKMLSNPFTSQFGSADDRELDGYSGGAGAWQITPIHPGDHIVFSVWIYVTDSSLGDTNPQHGMEIGMDLYSVRGRLCEISTANGQTSNPNYPTRNPVVNWGTNIWTHVTVDFVVQPTYLSDPWGAYQGGGTYETPTGFVPYFNSEALTFMSEWHGEAEQGVAYIADPMLYINPSGSSVIPVIIIALVAFLLITTVYERHRNSNKNLKKKLNPKTYKMPFSWVQRLNGG